MRLILVNALLSDQIRKSPSLSAAILRTGKAKPVAVRCPANGAACQWHGFSTDRSGAETCSCKHSGRPTGVLCKKKRPVTASPLDNMKFFCHDTLVLRRMCMFRWLRDNGKIIQGHKKNPGKTVCHLIMHNSINSGVYLSALFHKKSAFS